MASEAVAVPVALPKISDPLASSITLLPKAERALSYRWTITNAKIISWLKSRTFPVVLPLKSDQASFWQLGVYIDGGWIHLYLYQSKTDGTEDLKPACGVKVTIAGCTFSIINPEKKEVLYSEALCNMEWTIGNTNKECGKVSVAYSNMDQYLCNGMLTIQVDALIQCVTDSIKVLSLEQTASQDDKSLPSKIKHFLDEKLFTDVTIKCGSEEFQAHKVILALQSPVFRRMFETDMKEKQSNIVEITDFDSKVVSNLLTHFYTGVAPDLETLTKELLHIANKYDVSQLFTVCENRLKSKINTSNFVETLLMADLLNALTLKRACLTYIYCNTPAVYSSSQWKHFRQNCDGHASLLMEIIEFLP